LCFVLLTGFFFGCKRDIPPLPANELRNVTFNLAGFESEAEPLGGSKAAIPMALDVPGKAERALLHLEPSTKLQYLYYCSFNNEDLEPEIAVDEVGTRITFEAVAEEPTFPNSNFAVDPYTGGKAFSLRGGQTVKLELPMPDVESLSEFAFDISSS